MLGDYYPLTTYSLANDVWMAWQFNRPETGDGMIQAFRRADSAYESARFKLSGLDAGTKYTVTDLDANQPKEMTGRDLMETGLLLTAPAQPSAMVITYRKAK
jgi:alpha-galactosidase